MKDCSKCELIEDLKEKDEYILDLEEECENLSEMNRLLIERIKEQEECINTSSKK